MAAENVELDTLPKWLLHHSKQRGERPAIREKSRGIWRTTTWRELADEVAALAARCRHAACSAADMSFCLATTDRASMPRCARRSGWAQSQCRSTRTRRPRRCRPDPERRGHSRLRREPGAGRQAARDPAPVPERSLHRLRQGPGHAPLQAAPARELCGALAAGPGARRREARLPAKPSSRAAPAKTRLSCSSPRARPGPPRASSSPHASLIDRARVAARDGGAERQRRGHGVSAAWLDRPEPLRLRAAMVVGYCVCCPESSETMLADMREIGPDLLPGDAAGAGGTAHRRYRCAWRMPGASIEAFTGAAWPSPARRRAHPGRRGGVHRRPSRLSAVQPP